MPSNLIEVNNSLVWIVPDSKIQELIDWLENNGEAK